MNFNYNTNFPNAGVQNDAQKPAVNNNVNNNINPAPNPAKTTPQTIDTTINTDNLKPLNKDTITICGKEVTKKQAVIFGIGGLIALAGAIAGIVYAIRHNKGVEIRPSGGPKPGPNAGKTSSISENAKLLKGEPKEIAPMDARAKKFIGNSKKMMDNAKECKKRALKTSSKVESTIDDVQKLFDSKAQKTADGRRIEIANGVMKEFASDDITVKRLSTFDGKTPKSIEEFIDSTKKNLIEFNAGKKTITYKENLVQNGADSIHDKEVLLYKGKLNRYIEGITEKADGSAKYQRMLDFNTSGKMESYAEKCEYTSLSEKFARILDFEISREMPNEYAENFIKHADGKETFGKNLSFIPGVNNPNAYTEMYEKMPNGNTKSKINVMFSKKGIIIGYEENSIDGDNKKWDKCFKRSHGKWYMEPSPK